MPPSPSYLAFDLGASSGRAVLGTLGGDRMELEVVHRFDTPVIERGEHLYWDIEALWAELQAGFGEAVKAAPGLRSLSVDSWAVDYVPLDANGSPVRLPYCYRDPRTNGMMEHAFAVMPAAAIYGHTGIQFLQFNTLFQLLADLGAEPHVLRRVHRYLPVADYFNFRFGGRAAVEVSMASTTQLLDVRTRQWSPAVFDAFGLDIEHWPEIVPSGTVLGTVRGTPDVAVIASCSHDTGSAVAASPVTDPRRSWAFVSSGTWSLLGVERTEPLLTPEARAAGFTHEAGAAVFPRPGAAARRRHAPTSARRSGAEGTIRFLKNLTGLWALQECVREWGDADWTSLEREARASPPGLARIELEDPRFLPRGPMAERLRGWCREHGQPVPVTRGSLVRVILESIAASYARALADLRRVTGEPVDVLHVFGGGSQNRLLCQLAADACAIPVIAGPAEATALGNLLLQARALGDLPAGLTLRDVAARSCTLETYHPDPAHVDDHASKR